MALRLGGCRRAIGDPAAASAGEVRGRGPEPSALAITAWTAPEGMVVMYAICRPLGATVALSGFISPSVVVIAETTPVAIWKPPSCGAPRGAFRATTRVALSVNPTGSRPVPTLSGGCPPDGSSTQVVGSADDGEMTSRASSSPWGAATRLEALPTRAGSWYRALIVGSARST